MYKSQIRILSLIMDNSDWPDNLNYHHFNKRSGIIYYSIGDKYKTIDTLLLKFSKILIHIF